MGAVAIATLGALVAVGVATGVLEGETQVYRAVEKDQSWLVYLPPAGTSLDLTVFALNSQNAAGVEMRRVDIADSANNQTASLCFAENQRALRRACPGSTFLGTSVRTDMKLPAVSQIAPYEAVDWMALLNKPAPDLADVQQFD